MKEETAGAIIEKFVRLKPKKHSLLVDNNREHKKGKSINKRLLRQ